MSNAAFCLVEGKGAEKKNPEFVKTVKFLGVRQHQYSSTGFHPVA